MTTLGDQSGQDRNLIIQAAGEMRLCSGAHGGGSIASKSGDRAAVIDVVAMCSRQIIAYIAPKSGG